MYAPELHSVPISNIVPGPDARGFAQTEAAVHQAVMNCPPAVLSGSEYGSVKEETMHNTVSRYRLSEGSL